MFDFDKFFEVLSQHASSTKWVINPIDKTLRTVEGYCPLCFVALKMGMNPKKEKDFYWHLQEFMRLIRPCPQIRDQIPPAADLWEIEAFPYSDWERRKQEIPMVRKRLIVTVGLTEDEICMK